MIKYPRVKPGDIISPDDFDRVQGDLDAIEQRLMLLELTRGSEPITITGPTTDVVQGTKITVTGNGFSVPGTRNSVILESTTITAIDTATTTTSLIITLPAMTDLPDGGKAMLLLVRNDKGGLGVWTLNVRKSAG